MTTLTIVRINQTNPTIVSTETSAPSVRDHNVEERIPGPYHQASDLISKGSQSSALITLGVLVVGWNQITICQQWECFPA